MQCQLLNDQDGKLVGSHTLKTICGESICTHLPSIKTLYWEPDNGVLRTKHAALLKLRQTVVLDRILRVFLLSIA